MDHIPRYNASNFQQTKIHLSWILVQNYGIKNKREFTVGRPLQLGTENKD